LLTEASLRYSREVAFAAASAYAGAAEARGAWDARLEALVVDGIMRGDGEESLLSRAAALGLEPTAPATVLVGNPPPDGDPELLSDIRGIAVRTGRGCSSACRVPAWCSSSAAAPPYQTTRNG
jgi:hypothetical protein